MEWLYFFGRFHVLVLHLPIGIICVTVLLEFLARRPRFAGLRTAIPFLWGAAALSALATALLGLAHSTEGGFTGESLQRHRALGISLALLTLAIWVLCVRAPLYYRRWQALLGVAALVLVTITGHYGGNLTHGPDYLFEYAPNALRRLAGEQVARPAPVNINDADVFTDVVHPLLMLRCGDCHGESTRKGKLSFATYDLILKGGEDYAAVVPGDLQQSEMYARITLSPSSADFMPRDKKTPLTPDQVQIIGWWIQVGAPANGSVTSLKAPDALVKLMSQQLALLKH